MRNLRNVLAAVATLVALAIVLPMKELVVLAQNTAQTVYAARIAVSDTQKHTVPVVASDTFTLNAATQTLTNKSLTSPTLTTPSLSGLLTGTTNSIGAGITNQILLTNTTAATNVLNQNSPTYKMTGQGWNTTSLASQTVSGEIYLTPVNGNPAVPFYAFDTVDGAGTRVTVMGVSPANVSFSGNLTATSGGVNIAAGGNYQFNTRSKILSGADGRFTFTNNAQSNGLELTFGATPTVTTCGTGTITAGSRNSAGEVTATGATACTVTFATPTFNNSPFCVASDETTAAALIVTVSTTVSMTVSGLTSGDKFFYMCMGRF